MIFKYIRFCKLTTNETFYNYELFAVTVHIGSLDMGHYIAYTKRYNKWYLFNDEAFEMVKEQDALN